MVISGRLNNHGLIIMMIRRRSNNYEICSCAVLSYHLSERPLCLQVKYNVENCDDSI